MHFIRRLPSLTPDDLQEMERFNPQSREAFEEEQKIQEFLKGGDPPPAVPPIDSGTRAISRRSRSNSDSAVARPM